MMQANGKSGGPMDFNQDPVASFKIFLLAVTGLLVLATTPIAVLLRPRCWGERILGFTGLYAAAFLLSGLGLLALVAVKDLFGVSLTAFLFLSHGLASSGMGLYLNWQVWKRKRAGDYFSVHSYDRGESWGAWYSFAFMGNQWIKTEDVIQRWLEPALVMLVSVPFWFLAPTFGQVLFLEGVALLLAEQALHHIRYQHFLDVVDAQITAQRLQYTLGLLSRDEFDPATRIPPPVRALYSCADPKVTRDVAGLMLGVREPELQALMGSNGTNGHSEGQQLPL